MTFHEYDVDWASVRRVLEGSAKGAARGFGTSPELSAHVPAALRDVLFVDESRVLRLVLEDGDEPCGLVLLVRPSNIEPFPGELCQLFGSLGPLLS